MKQYILLARHKQFFWAMMGLGLLCLILSYFFEPEQIEAAGYHTRFWSNFLLNSAFFTGIAFMMTFVIAAFVTAYSGWHVVFKRVMESFSLFLTPGLVLMLIIGLGIYLHLHHLYHWGAEGITDPSSPNYDKILDGKSGFLNPHWYFFGTLIIGGAWAFFANRFRKYSLEEDKYGADASNFAYTRRTRWFAAFFLPIAAFTGPALIWQWIMSVDAHWYSTLFAWYTMASWFLAGCSLLILVVIFLKSQGYLEEVTREHLQDLGKYMFAFTIFWTYCWFSQYMLIWYGNVGEETIYFRERLDNYPVLFYGNLIVNFLLPFLILMRNTTKRRYGTLIFTSVLVFFGHWWDFFYMIKPGTFLTAKHAIEHVGSPETEVVPGSHLEAVEHTSSFAAGFTIPGLLEIGILVGFLGFFLYWVFTRLEKAPLVAKNDPYIEESLHHEVQPYE